ncbi:MAG: 16S rRNA (guanine(527)-N(7))-methyltransferase RsmG [Betaproteobacteria bacterium]|nr:16S rRNA (guanine(527)-N(7))-methyltransferase RsmG [Betaproteobacteria bacterium]
MSLEAELEQGIAGLDLTLPPQTQARLLEYLALLQKWNRVYNLTAVRELSKMVSHHLLDCLAVAPHVTASAILDVGSGAGLPGIPLALALPHAHVTLLESSHKKAAFLQQAKFELKLDNTTVVCERVETWRPGRAFELVISRAFSDLAEFVTLAGRHAAPGGRLAAMKGVYPHGETAQLPSGWRLQKAIALSVPGLHAQRHLLMLERE